VGRQGRGSQSSKGLAAAGLTDAAGSQLDAQGSDGRGKLSHELSCHLLEPGKNLPALVCTSWSGPFRTPGGDPGGATRTPGSARLG
jgi:hypothetical protein